MSEQNNPEEGTQVPDSQEQNSAPAQENPANTERKSQFANPDSVAPSRAKRHVVAALEMMEMNMNRNKDFIEIKNPEEEKGVAPVVSFTIQSDPIGEVGVNGCQASDMLSFVTCLFRSLNDAFPCTENAKTLESLDEAIYWQDKRTQDRIKRGVEGENKK